ncbi:MAG TPA: helix-hairpin-helix domain-containing protein [Usitatibacter sp.]
MNRIAVLLAAIVFPAGIALASADVNTATKQELEAEGIGSVASQAIIDYRTRNGPFKSAEEVRRVVSDAIAAKMNIGISISGPASAKSAAPQEKSADAKAAPAPDAKGPIAAGKGKPEEKPAAKDDRTPDNVRERAMKDQDDRKT